MPGEYTIAGGLADAQRLARQAHVMASQSSAFLSRIGLASGWACLDVGCEDGQVTLAMAGAAGPSGRAVGVDMDADALAIAREAAMRAGVRAEFLQADAVCPIETEAFDLAYAWLLLSHLIDPSAAVRAMRAEVRPGGVVAVEDIFLGTLRSDPPEPALDRLQEIYGGAGGFPRGDPHIGTCAPRSSRRTPRRTPSSRRSREGSPKRRASPPPSSIRPASTRCRGGGRSAPQASTAPGARAATPRAARAPPRRSSARRRGAPRSGTGQPRAPLPRAPPTRR